VLQHAFQNTSIAIARFIMHELAKEAKIGGGGVIFSYPKIHCEINMDAYYVVGLLHYTKVVEIPFTKPF